MATSGTAFMVTVVLEVYLLPTRATADLLVRNMNFSLQTCICSEKIHRFSLQMSDEIWLVENYGFLPRGAIPRVLYPWVNIFKIKTDKAGRTRRGCLHSLLWAVRRRWTEQRRPEYSSGDEKFTRNGCVCATNVVFPKKKKHMPRIIDSNTISGSCWKNYA